MIHRDIKPENLLLDASAGRYVIDGCASPIWPHSLPTPTGGTVAGTARSTAPELSLGEPIDGHADLYALDVTLFIAATGRAPFAGTSAMALVLPHTTQPAPSVRQGAPTLPLALACAIDRCLAKQPDGRVADAEQFLPAIAAAVRAEPSPPMVLILPDHDGELHRRRSRSRDGRDSPRHRLYRPDRDCNHAFREACETARGQAEPPVFFGALEA